MKETRTITKLQKTTDYGYTLVANLIQDTNEHGVTTYCLRVVEEWEDGHSTLASNGYTDFRFNKDLGNDTYKKYLKEGYTFVNKDTITPTKIDMR